MDQRETFATHEQLYQMISLLFNNGQKASLLVDNNGVTRIEGEITSLEKKEDVRRSILTIKNEKPFILQQIIAVNGIFHSDYSEC